MITTRTPSARRSFLSLPFVTSVVVLLIAAIGLHPALAALSKHYSKEVIEIRKSLDDLDLSRLDSYQVVPGYEDFTTTADDLGTEDWIKLHFAKRDFASLYRPRRVGWDDEDRSILFAQ